MRLTTARVRLLVLVHPPPLHVRTLHLRVVECMGQHPGTSEPLSKRWKCRCVAAGDDEFEREGVTVVCGEGRVLAGPGGADAGEEEMVVVRGESDFAAI